MSERDVTAVAYELAAELQGTKASLLDPIDIQHVPTESLFRARIGTFEVTGSAATPGEALRDLVKQLRERAGAEATEAETKAKALRRLAQTKDTT